MSKIGIFNENAEFFEEFCNSQEDTALDRFGRERKTIEGIDNGVTDLINNKIIAQGGLDVLQERGNRTDAAMSQKSISSNLDNIDADISRIDNEVSQKWDTQTTVGTGDIVRESSVPEVVNDTGQSTVDAISQKAFTDLCFGIGQEWVDVTSSRSKGTTYTNNTGKPIMISINIFSGNAIGGPSSSIYINGLEVAMMGVSDQYTQNKCMTVIVPEGNTYKYDGELGFMSWRELR